MAFRIVYSYSAAGAGNEVLLVKVNWKDWLTWIMQFFVAVVAPDGQRVDIGQAQIARRGTTGEFTMTAALLPLIFDQLDASWLSIGQSENHYRQLHELGDARRGAD